jgi:hypothetical protein
MLVLLKPMVVEDFVEIVLHNHLVGMVVLAAELHYSIHNYCHSMNMDHWAVHTMGPTGSLNPDQHRVVNMG